MELHDTDALVLAVRIRPGSPTLLPLAAGASWLLFVALATEIQLGVRYLLPALPLLRCRRRSYRLR